MHEEGEGVLHQLGLGPSKFQLQLHYFVLVCLLKFFVQVVMCENVMCDWPFKDINGISIIPGKV